MHCVISTSSAISHFDVRCDDPNSILPWISAVGPVFLGVFAVVAALIALRGTTRQANAAIEAARKQAEAVLESQREAARLSASRDAEARQEEREAVRRQVRAYLSTAVSSLRYIFTKAPFPSDYDDHLLVLQRFLTRLYDLDTASAFETKELADALNSVRGFEIGFYALKRRWSEAKNDEATQFFNRRSAYWLLRVAREMAVALKSDETVTDIEKIFDERRDLIKEINEPDRREGGQ
jgi:hypothetical protein